MVNYGRIRAMHKCPHCGEVCDCVIYDMWNCCCVHECEEEYDEDDYDEDDDDDDEDWPY